MKAPETHPKSLSNAKPIQEQERAQTPLIKLAKHPTYSTLWSSEKGGSAISFGSVPSPLESDQSISNEARYLSYLDFDKEIAQNEESCCEFFPSLYRCAIYLKKEGIRSQVDDKLMLDQLAQHININLTKPQPKSSVGKRLLANGYALAAISVMMGRLHQSLALLQYYMGMFENWQMDSNHEQFLYYHSSDYGFWEIQAGDKKKQGSDKKSVKRNVQETVPKGEQQEKQIAGNCMLATKSSMKKIA